MRKTRFEETGQRPGFRLSGGGWYETDFKTGDKKNIAGERGDTADKPAAKTESGSTSSEGAKKTESTPAATAKTDTSKAG